MIRSDIYLNLLNLPQVMWCFEAMFWGKLGHGDPPLYTNTYEGHKWNIRVDGEIVREFVIGGDKRQRFEI